MPWLQATVTAPAELGARVEDALTACGATAVSLRDFDDTPQSSIFEPGPGETPLWPSLMITGLFPEATETAWVESILKRDLGRHGRCRWEVLRDQAWERAWLQDFQPLTFGDRLCVCPHHLKPPPGRVAVMLDPGLAFGTGTHPTTGLCLDFLCRQDLQGRTLLDFGCGSGILAIAALKLGAARAIAVDNDPQALMATGDNAHRNAVADKLQILTPDAMPGTTPEVIVANILAATLIELADLIGPLAAGGGHLALSGILPEQTDAVAACYAAYVGPMAIEQRDGWSLLWGRGKS